MRPKILFCLLVHGEPKQTLRLIRAIYNGHDYFVIHVDQKASAAYKRLLDGLRSACPNITVISKQKCGWGGFSLVRASNAMFELGINAHADWTHAFLLSGTHLPLMPVESIRSALTLGKSCFKWHELASDVVPEPQDRWLKSICDRIDWSFEETEDGRMIKGEHLGRPEFSYFVGSQWVMLARDHVGYVLAAANNPIGQRLAHSNVADEAFYQTLLKNSQWSEDCWYKESTAVFWSSGSWSPKVLTLDDYEELAKKPPAWFTRKFIDEMGEASAVTSVIDRIAGPVECPDLPEHVKDLAAQASES